MYIEYTIVYFKYNPASRGHYFLSSRGREIVLQQGLLVARVPLNNHMAMTAAKLGRSPNRSDQHHVVACMPVLQPVWALLTTRLPIFLESAVFLTTVRHVRKS